MNFGRSFSVGVASTKNWGPLKLSDRKSEPFLEIAAQAQFDPHVAELPQLAEQLRDAQTPAHKGVGCDFNGS